MLTLDIWGVSNKVGEIGCNWVLMGYVIWVLTPRWYLMKFIETINTNYNMIILKEVYGHDAFWKEWISRIYRLGSLCVPGRWWTNLTWCEFKETNIVNTTILRVLRWHFVSLCGEIWFSLYDILICLLVHSVNLCGIFCKLPLWYYVWTLWQSNSICSVFRMFPLWHVLSSPCGVLQ